MCGIVGVYYFQPGSRATTENLKAMTDRMIHRGPDDEGFFCQEHVGLGMRRLSIIDLEGGHQPIFNQDRSKVIVFNGEAYNYRENKRILEGQGVRFFTNSDTEVVLQLFDHLGTDGLQKINGMFGFAVWDDGARILTIARDRIGIKPLYYYRDSEKLVFASEIKSILAYPGVACPLDHVALAHYLKYGFTPENQTLYTRIQKLPPANYMQVSEKGIRIKTYWTLSYADKYRATESQISQELYELLRSSVNYRMIADVPLGAFLSSGMDSSSIVHLMHELGADPLNTYTIGFGSGYDQFNELDMARKFANHYGTNHHEITVRPIVSELFPELVVALDEPLADSSFIMTYLVSKLARETVKVILSGVGGDELFGGYRRYLNVRLNNYFRYIPGPLIENMLWPLFSRLPEDRNHKLLNYFRLLKAYMRTASLPMDKQYLSYAGLMGDDLLKEMMVGDEQYIDNHHRLFNECDSDDLLDKLLYIDLKTSLCEQLLMLTDKMSMYTSLEARVPYLDHRMVEFAARIPGQYKLKGFKLRHVQKRTFRRKLPSFVFRQVKRGFGAPVGNWVRSDLKGMMLDYLSPGKLKAQGLFNTEVVNKIVRAHLDTQADFTDILLGMIAFQIWWRQNNF